MLRDRIHQLLLSSSVLCTLLMVLDNLKQMYLHAGLLLQGLEQDTQGICIAFFPPGHEPFSVFSDVLSITSLEKEKSVIPNLQLRHWLAERLIYLMIGHEEWNEVVSGEVQTGH